MAQSVASPRPSPFSDSIRWRAGLSAFDFCACVGESEWARGWVNWIWCSQKRAGNRGVDSEVSWGHSCIGDRWVNAHFARRQPPRVDLCLSPGSSSSWPGEGLDRNFGREQDPPTFLRQIWLKGLVLFLSVCVIVCTRGCTGDPLYGATPSVPGAEGSQRGCERDGGRRPDQNQAEAKSNQFHPGTTQWAGEAFWWDSLPGRLHAWRTEPTAGAVRGPSAGTWLWGRPGATEGGGAHLRWGWRGCCWDTHRGCRFRGLEWGEKGKDAFNRGLIFQSRS